MVTMIGLPLLIVNGKFQSLGSMTVEDLETFIPFLVKCSINRAGAQLINGVPEWWTSNVPFKFPLRKPKGLSEVGYRRHLASIVCSCYWYHDAQYLLPFCAKVASSPESVFLQNNEDNTTSIFYVQNTSHILKFNNENTNYDKKPQKEKPLRRSLLSALPKKPTVVPDIYLCENCDAEFYSHSEIQKHEKECYEVITIDDVTDEHKVGSGGSVTGFSENGKIIQDLSFKERKILKHVQLRANRAAEKHNFFNYLRLEPRNGDQSLSKSRNQHYHNCVKIKNVYINCNIEFSSLFGRRMLNHNEKQDLMNKIEKNFMVTEHFCATNTYTYKTNREQKELNQFKVTCRRPKKNTWVHQYSFSKKQRRNRYKTLKTGLNEHSRKLLKQCKKLHIVLNRINVVS